MKLTNGKISLLVGQDYTTIELYDSVSCSTFVKVVLTNEQLASALSRLAHTPCKEVEVNGLEKNR